MESEQVRKALAGAVEAWQSAAQLENTAAERRWWFRVNMLFRFFTENDGFSTYCHVVLNKNVALNIRKNEETWRSWTFSVGSYAPSNLPTENPLFYPLQWFFQRIFPWCPKSRNDINLTQKFDIGIPPFFSHWNHRWTTWNLEPQVPWLRVHSEVRPPTSWYPPHPWLRRWPSMAGGKGPLDLGWIHGAMIPKNQALFSCGLGGMGQNYIEGPKSLFLYVFTPSIEQVFLKKTYFPYFTDFTKLSDLGLPRMLRGTTYPCPWRWA